MSAALLLFLAQTLRPICRLQYLLLTLWLQLQGPGADLMALASAACLQTRRTASGRQGHRALWPLQLCSQLVALAHAAPPGKLIS